MEAATLGPPPALLPSLDRPGRCEPMAAREHEPRTCGERRSRCAAEATIVSTLRYRRSERTALYIETQEGDVVRLKIKVLSSLSAEAAASKGETELAEVSVSSRNSVKIRFTVDGDLHADELAAIRNVVEQASGLAAELFAGDAPEAFATAANLEIDGAQLARVSLRLSLREHLTYAASGRYAASAAVAALPRAEPAPAPSEERTNGAGSAPSAPAAAAPAAPSAAAGEAADPPAAPEDAAPADEPAIEEPLPPTTSLPASSFASAALTTIAAFLAHLLDTLAAPEAPEHDGAPSVHLELKLRVFHSVALTLAATQVAAPENAASGMPLLNDTLDALAAHERPLDATA